MAPRLNVHQVDRVFLGAAQYAREVNSGPLYERMPSGMPRSSIKRSGAGSPDGT